MKLHPLREAPPAWLAEALERFEARFTYPLGEKVRFRISHGRDYMPFFKAMGDATVWVAERGGEVLGTLAAIPRTIHLPDGQSQRTAYLCDLKITSGPHAGRTLATLAQTVNTALAGIGIRSAYSVVMTGTSHTPEEYTGRLGIPLFELVDEFTVCKVLVPAGLPSGGRSHLATADEINSTYTALNRGRFFAAPGTPALRSLMTPAALLGTNGLACGLLEDTRHGKRLWLETGEELCAAHLSRFAYDTIADGAQLIRDALGIATEAQMPAVFVALPSCDVSSFTAKLGDLRFQMAGARVYGCGLSSTGLWSVDTSEI